MLFAFRSPCLVAMFLFLASSSPAADTYDLTSALKPGQIQAVRTAVEVKGDLKLNPDGKEVVSVPMVVHADLHYAEWFLAIKADGTLRAARQYSKAEATIQIKDSELKESLREERQLMVAQYKG